jgi:hypothetical protein
LFSVCRPALDTADVGWVEAGAFSEFFLVSFAGAADVEPEGEKDSVAFRHD